MSKRVDHPAYMYKQGKGQYVVCSWVESVRMYSASQPMSYMRARRVIGEYRKEERQNA